MSLKEGQFGDICDAKDYGMVVLGISFKEIVYLRMDSKHSENSTKVSVQKCFNSVVDSLISKGMLKEK